MLESTPCLFLITRVNQKFCNILVSACLWNLYDVFEAVQDVKGTHSGW